MNIPGMVTGTALAAIAIGSVESSLPVVALMEAVSGVHTENSYVARVQGYKVKDCIVVDDSFVGWQMLDGIWQEVPFRFVNDDTPNDSKPKALDKQDFGVWRWDDVSLDSEQVRLSLQHNCDGHLTITTINFKL